MVREEGMKPPTEREGVENTGVGFEGGIERGSWK